VWDAYKGGGGGDYFSLSLNNTANLKSAIFILFGKNVTLL